jgi:hypothetical protein
MRDYPIIWDFKDWCWRGITTDQIHIWQTLYPDVDILKALKEDMPRAIDREYDHTTGKKRRWIRRKVDWKRTITNWLRKEQMKVEGIL